MGNTGHFPPKQTSRDSAVHVRAPQPSVRLLTSGGISSDFSPGNELELELELVKYSWFRLKRLYAGHFCHHWLVVFNTAFIFLGGEEWHISHE